MAGTPAVVVRAVVAETGHSLRGRDEYASDEKQSLVACANLLESGQDGSHPTSS
jgi:hypothetical protein